MDFSVSADILSEILEVAVHMILYTREIYPSAAFQRRKKYNIAVQMCIHPGLNSYISDCIGSIKTVLEKGDVEKVVVAILSEDKVPLEKFIFEIHQEPIRPQKIKEDPQLIRLEESLRSFCLKLSISDSLLKPLPGQCSFAVHLHVPEPIQTVMSANHLNQNFPWIEAEKKQVEVLNPQIVPLRSFKTELCRMQLYVEESTSGKN